MPRRGRVPRLLLCRRRSVSGIVRELWTDIRRGARLRRILPLIAGMNRARCWSASNVATANPRARRCGVVAGFGIDPALVVLPRSSVALVGFT